MVHTYGSPQGWRTKTCLNAASSDRCYYLFLQALQVGRALLQAQIACLKIGLHTDAIMSCGPKEVVLVCASLQEVTQCNLVMACAGTSSPPAARPAAHPAHPGHV